MSFKMVVELDIKVRSCEILLDEDDIAESFEINCNIDPFLIYNNKIYNYIGIYIDESARSFNDYQDWKNNYMYKIDKFRLGNYDDRFETVRYEQIMLEDIKKTDINLYSNLYKEVQKQLVKRNL